MECGPRADWAPERYEAASPIERLPLGVPVLLLHGALEDILGVSHSRRFAEEARRSGDEVEVWEIPGAGHFDLIAPFAPAWRRVEEAVRKVLRER